MGGMKAEGSSNRHAAIPDVAGYTFKRAAKLLEESGVAIRAVKIAAQPKETIMEHDDTFRVIKVKPLDDNTVELLVCKPL
ncbi:hypothetical protein CDQ84_02895 [Clostridium thermosuccinogenes]|jgi:beta-lactam-binding protein with PASTA domain|uniref:PASTA domain-containing protein n=2 Tax=Clostridium thermosuccinogenes TaxID=84032 RepID=A0A2K2FQN7_9CLOT|nr:hypothetical protein [Pseudoclostridium thermosuccinogenes]AUS96015.1 hypothetical protein CDO33_05920 [Pseudoclostridium thermosuccinogenes]PNT93261.1 hypothetical protein CDQ83_07010 [Pseudoclostridium thermosuccinogenes]PNT99404.1 hypothetical protein CDQ85_02895 [Pseudoclostridium thermosuccinogenes]PNU01091.1 hypothetical protein CDQ84_02895 [Pseudoclostridium thermosuccinogenes]